MSSFIDACYNTARANIHSLADSLFSNDAPNREKAEIYSTAVGVGAVAAWFFGGGILLPAVGLYLSYNASKVCSNISKALPIEISTNTNIINQSGTLSIATKYFSKQNLKETLTKDTFGFDWAVDYLIDLAATKPQEVSISANAQKNAENGLGYLKKFFS